MIVSDEAVEAAVAAYYGAEGTPSARLRAALTAALPFMALLLQPTGEPIAWRVKDWADGWIFYFDKEQAEIEAGIMGGATIQPLYATSPDVETLTAERDAALARAAGLRPEVLAFAHLMEAQLRANDHKPGWKRDSWASLFLRLCEEAQQLERQLDHSAFYDNGDRGARMVQVPSEIAGRRAAHVANFAMMIADVFGALSPAPDTVKGDA